eukprot:4205001-Amphidinium_carterae.1
MRDEISNSVKNYVGARATTLIQCNYDTPSGTNCTGLHQAYVCPWLVSSETDASGESIEAVLQVQDLAMGDGGACPCPPLLRESGAHASCGSIELANWCKCACTAFFAPAGISPQMKHRHGWCRSFRLHSQEAQVYSLPETVEIVLLSGVRSECFRTDTCKKSNANRQGNGNVCMCLLSKALAYTMVHSGFSASARCNSYRELPLLLVALGLVFCNGYCEVVFAQKQRSLVTLEYAGTRSASPEAAALAPHGKKL